MEEQGLLEELLESSKPPLPRDAEFLGLHYLLATPFRVGLAAGDKTSQFFVKRLDVFLPGLKRRQVTGERRHFQF